MIEFCSNKKTIRKDLGGGISRKVLSHSPALMTVEIESEIGTENPVHSHPHEQITYIVSGSYRFYNEEESYLVGPGDTLHFPTDTPHGNTCLQAGRVVDVFTPAREDFLV